MFQPPKIQTECPVTWAKFSENPNQGVAKLALLRISKEYDIPDSPDSSPDKSQLLKLMIDHNFYSATSQRLDNLVRFLNHDEVCQLQVVCDFVESYAALARTDPYEETQRKILWPAVHAVTVLMSRHERKIRTTKPTFTRVIVSDEERDSLRLKVPKVDNERAVVPYRDESVRQNTVKCSDDGAFQQRQPDGSWKSVDIYEYAEGQQDSGEDTEDDELMVEEWAKARQCKN